MMRVPAAFIALLLPAVAGLASAPSPSSGSGPGPWPGPWNELRSLYSSGKFEEALHLLKSHAGSDSAYHYNLGTLSYRLGKYGDAVAHLEKASRLAPDDEDLAHNLELARSALGRMVGNGRLDPASNWIERLSDSIRLLGLQSTLGLLSVLMGLLGGGRLARAETVRAAMLQPALWVSLCGCGLLASLYGAARWGAAHPAMVSLEAQTVRSGPGDHFLELGRLDAGTQIRALSDPVPSGDSGGGEHAPSAWRQVRFSPGNVGWVRDAALLPL